MRRLFTLLAGAGLALSIAVAPVAAKGPPGIGFYVDGSLYRTVGTPTDFSATGAPAHSFDTIYALGGSLMNVADAAPGDRDFNGGRWQVVPVTWIADAVQLTSAEQVLAYADAGMLTIGAPVKWFECPVIPLQGNAR